MFGYTIGNDMSARDIEGENPLYLPQAKIHKRCCSIGPVVVTPDEVPNPKDLDFRCRILRHGQIVFDGNTNTSKMRRSFRELVYYLLKDNEVPVGTVLLTGTGIVPPEDFALKDGDVIEITVDKIGTLRNSVQKLH